jgi:hypothetical protein
MGQTLVVGLLHRGDGREPQDPSDAARGHREAEAEAPQMIEGPGSSWMHPIAKSGICQCPDLSFLSFR